MFLNKNGCIITRVNYHLYYYFVCTFAKIGITIIGFSSKNMKKDNILRLAQLPVHSQNKILESKHRSNLEGELRIITHNNFHNYATRAHYSDNQWKCLNSKAFFKNYNNTKYPVHHI